MNQRELAAKAGVSQSTITRAERGVGVIPSAVFATLGVDGEGGLLAAAEDLERPAASREPLPADLSLYAASQGKTNVVAWERAGGSASRASAMLGGTPTRQAIARSVETARRRKAAALDRANDAS